LLGQRSAIAAVLIFCAGASGCMTGPVEYFRNGLKVGPNYQKPDAAVASEWIDNRDPRISTVPPLEPAWWKAFNDPLLDHLTSGAYQQNLTLRRLPALS